MRVILCSIAVLSILFCTSTAPASARGGQKQQQQNQQPAEKKDDLPADDPAVDEASPPPPDAKMLTKVGWCEVQVFGHTFSDAGLTKAAMPVTHMHLPDRLQKLNQQLKFKPAKKGLDLMDDIDALVTFVQNRPKKS